MARTVSGISVDFVMTVYFVCFLQRLVCDFLCILIPPSIESTSHGPVLGFLHHLLVTKANVCVNKCEGGTGSGGNRDCLFPGWGQHADMIHFRSVGLPLQTHTHRMVSLPEQLYQHPPGAVVDIYQENAPSVLPQNVRPSHVLRIGLSKSMTSLMIKWWLSALVRTRFDQIAAPV